MSLDNYDFKECVSYQYDTERRCYEYGCELEGICRCSKIVNPKILDVDISKVSAIIFDHYFDKSVSTKRNETISNILFDVNSDINLYTIDRILRINKIFNSEVWDLQICNGYYGEEVGEILLNFDVWEKIKMQIDSAFEIFELRNRIHYLLLLEYGYLLDELKNVSFKIETVERSSLRFGNDTHLKNTKSENLEHYSDKNYSGIRGVTLQQNGYLRLVDGYHRCLATENSKVKLIVAYS